MRRGLLISTSLATTCLWLAIASSCLAQQQTWTGYVTDTHCGTNCQVTKDMTPDLNCIRECIRKGSKYGLWTNGKVYVLEPQDRAAKLAARNVQVKGTLNGDTIQAESIELIKSPLKPATPHKP